MPLIMAVCVVIGIMIGSFFANRFSGNRLNVINSGSNRITNLLRIIDDMYVDKVDIDSLVEDAMPKILESWILTLCISVPRMYSLPPMTLKVRSRVLAWSS